MDVDKAAKKYEKDGPGLCRCCLSEDGSFRDLAKRYPWMSETEIYADMLRECFNINMCQYSEGPTGVKNIICNVCVILLRDAYHFKKQVLTSERKFAEIMLARREKAKVQDDSSFKYEDLDGDGLESDDDGLEAEVEQKFNTPPACSSGNVECKVEVGETKDHLVCLPSGEWKVTADGIKRHKTDSQSSAIQPALIQKDNAVAHSGNGEKTFICDTCGKCFNRKSKLSEHELTHTGVKSFICDVCGKSFYTKNYMQRHIKEIHRDNKHLPCHVCGMSVKDMKKHLLVHSTTKPFTCNMCEKSFKRKTCLTQHMQTHSGTKPYACDVCPKTFNTNGILQEHLCVHSGVKPYACNICKKSFVQRSHLRRHLQCVHTNTKEFSCHICGIAVKEKRTLAKHLLCHSTDTKPFECQLCDKTFKVKEYLTQHMSYVHSDAKPVACILCGKSYKLKRYLTEHMSLVHGGARPFACHICDKTFKLKVVLKDHLLRHSKPRPYVCNICGKAYSGKSCLKKHLSRHNEIKSEALTGL